ncbi:MAG TPA: peptidylprolyl isomerase, partial [Rikenellaceae bacterium]|nr:peptidylprolyl isomerase [Rikenellaceae bacterium]
KVREDLLVVGYTIPMLNSEGQVINGTVKAVSDDTVTMDFNHPMAGKTLHFTGKVESVREATDKELTEGLHGEYLPQEGCHCGGHCSDGCDGGCHGDGECSCGDDCGCGK